MKHIGARVVPFLLAAGFLLVNPTNQDHIDFRYAPARSFSVICLPTDWLKSAVTESGALVYDFGPGPYVQPFTEVSLSFTGDSLRVQRQFLPDPEVPRIQTDLESSSGTMRQQTFALVPQTLEYPLGVGAGGRVRRLGGLNGCAGWARIPPGTDSLFRNVAWGTNRPIRYRVAIEPGGWRTVALGLCESYKTRPGMRVLDLLVEGAPALRVDPVAGGKNGIPIASVLYGIDMNHDGELSIEVHAAPGSDPNVILNAFWVFGPGTQITSKEIVNGTATPRAEIAYSCGLEAERSVKSPRYDVMIADISAKNAQPAIQVRSARTLRFDPISGTLYADGSPFLRSSPSPTHATAINGVVLLELPRGTAHAEILVAHGPTTAPMRIPDLAKELQRAQRYWKHEAQVPRGTVKVPDPGLQYLIDASIRTIYQDADVVDSCFQFQPGPSVYRGLWVGDMALIAPQMLSLGDTLHVRRYIEATLRYRRPDGQIRVGVPTEFLPETPMVMNAIWRYAQSTGDRQWLMDHWSVMVEGASWLQRARQSTLQDSLAPYFGLMPPGFLDGGLSEAGADYGSVWWAMIGLEKATACAEWLGRDSLAAAWKSSMHNFMQSFRTSVRRNLRRDSSGVPYLPIIIGDTSRNFPQRGQYAFLLPLRFGDFFDTNDPLIDSVITGTLAMLDSRTKEGLIVSSGWLTDAVWPWLGGVHALAHEWFGDPHKAVEIIYAFGNHATTTGTFLEEQLTRDKGIRTSGDASDAEASSLLIDAVRSLILRERQGSLELFPGIPSEWLTRGATVELNGGFTLFGPISLRCQVSSDGSSVTVTAKPVDGRGMPGHVIVLLRAFRDAGFRTIGGEELPERMELSWQQPISLRFARPK